MKLSMIMQTFAKNLNSHILPDCIYNSDKVTFLVLFYTDVPFHCRVLYILNRVI